jgi:zinc/manganese transport system ATP-binding protein
VTAIRFDNVTLRLGARTVLSGIDLSIGEGEFVGLLGANGSGKTTLFRAVLGLIAPVAGEIRILGETPRRGNPKAGYLPQARRGGAELRLRGADFAARESQGRLPAAGAARRGGAPAARRGLRAVGGRRRSLGPALALRRG